jgi:hypothetical protein
VAEREEQGRRRHRRHRRRSGAGADQPIEDVAAVGRRIKDDDAGADQRLADPDVVGQPAADSGIFARRDQEEPEQPRCDHPRRRGQQPDLDRVADEQQGGDDDRGPADPDQQPPADQPLEQPAERLPCHRFGRLLLNRNPARRFPHRGLGCRGFRHGGRRRGAAPAEPGDLALQLRDSTGEQRAHHEQGDDREEGDQRHHLS